VGARFRGLLVALALTPAANAQAATINVSLAGSDTNPGTTTAPLKTLGKALSKAVAGDTVKLAGGGYCQGPAASGEQIPATGLLVPSGVTIDGATENGFPVSTLLGHGGGVGLRFAGNATVRNLFVGGGAGFGVGLYAKQGKQTLSNLFITTRSPASATVATTRVTNRSLRLLGRETHARPVRGRGSERPPRTTVVRRAA
jgi:hypothetical protein